MTTTRRRPKAKGVRVVKTGLQIVQADALTRALFGTNIMEFLTGKVNGTFNPGADGYQIVTLPELIGMTKHGWNGMAGGNYGTKTFKDAIAYNLSRNGTNAVATVIAARVGVKVLKQMGVFRDLNAMNKALGLQNVARWS